MKDLYNEKFKTLKIEAKEDTRRWKYLSCSWIGSISIVKIVILLKAICNTISIKILVQICICIYVCIILYGNTKVQGYPKSSWTIKKCYRVIIIETAFSVSKNRNIDQRNGVDDPNISPHSYGHLTFDNKAHSTYLEKIQYLWQMVLVKQED